MIARSAAPLLGWFASRRRRQWDALWRDPAAAQQAALLRLVRAAQATEWGLVHGFGDVRCPADYQARVPLGEYRDFRPLWERSLDGEEDVTWPGRARDWVRTPGTTGDPKLVPVTPEALRSHRRGGWDAVLVAAERAGARALTGGPLLLLGGASTVMPVGSGCRVGDLSGLAVHRLPACVRERYAPDPEIAAIPDWEARVDAMAAQAATQDLRLIAGMPPWLVVLFERVARRLEAIGRPMPELGRCWPELRALIHGGVGFAPYAGVFDEWLGRRLERVEVYPAAEAFVAIQTERMGGLTLMLDYDVFYEFVPVEDLGRPRGRRHTVADLGLNRHYAVFVTTAAGLWSYALGDTVRFTHRDPLRLVITGRTRHVLDAFGERVIGEEVERALLAACRRTETEVVEYAVAPRFPGAGQARGGHEWLIEFRTPPREPEEFGRILDETLAVLNADYRAKRRDDAALLAPRVTALPGGAFFRWMRAAGKLGDQHKVPRLTSTRAMAESLLAAAGGGWPLPSHPGAVEPSRNSHAAATGRG